MRLIDADKMINNLESMKTMYDAIELDGMIKGLKESKTVDAVTVVRCKECRHADTVRGYEGLKCVWCNRRQTVENEYGFCYNAEKMDGEAE